MQTHEVVLPCILHCIGCEITVFQPSWMYSKLSTALLKRPARAMTPTVRPTGSMMRFWKSGIIYIVILDLRTASRFCSKL
jgi:hypothetical protein